MQYKARGSLTPENSPLVTFSPRDSSDVRDRSGVVWFVCCVEMSCLLCVHVQVKVVPEEVLQEIHIMKHLSHPQLVKLHEIIDDDTCKYLYLVMEYVEVTIVLHWVLWQ